MLTKESGVHGEGYYRNEWRSDGIPYVEFDEEGNLSAREYCDEWLRRHNPGSIVVPVHELCTLTELVDEVIRSITLACPRTL